MALLTPKVEAFGFQNFFLSYFISKWNHHRINVEIDKQNKTKPITTGMILERAREPYALAFALELSYFAGSEPGRLSLSLGWI